MPRPMYVHKKMSQPIYETGYDHTHYWEYYKRQHLKVVQNHTTGKKILEDHKLYEYLWALKLGYIMYDDVPPDYLRSFGIFDGRDFGGKIQGPTMLHWPNIIRTAT